MNNLVAILTNYKNQLRASSTKRPDLNTGWTEVHVLVEIKILHYDQFKTFANQNYTDLRTENCYNCTLRNYS